MKKQQTYTLTHRQKQTVESCLALAESKGVYADCVLPRVGKTALAMLHNLQPQAPLNEYWITRGRMSDDPDTLQAYRDKFGGDPQAGDDEWQFGDGPSGQRGSSADFPTLATGMAATAPAIYHFDPMPEVVCPDPVLYQSLIQNAATLVCDDLAMRQNAEYTRALVELILFQMGYSSDLFDSVVNDIRAEFSKGACQ